MDDLAAVQHRFHAAGHDQRGRSTLYADLNRRIAEDPAIAALLLAAPAPQQLPVLLLAAVHSIVLAEPGLELAAWYPTTSGSPRTDAPYPAFRRLCVDRTEQIRDIVATRTVQTNEVGRCALLLPALAQVETEVEQGIRLIDVGTSAGLNLLLDRFEYRYDQIPQIGGPSPVVLACGTRGDVTLPDHVPRIADRVGIDRAPIDPTDPEDAQWLLACVWPDQPDRIERLRGAIAIANDHPPVVTQGDALRDTAHTVVQTPRNLHPVIINSWVLNYLSESDQRAYAEQLDEVGRTHDLTWIYAESPGLCPGLPVPDVVRGIHTTVVMLLRWRNGRRTEQHIGTGHPHGYWLHAPDG